MEYVNRFHERHMRSLNIWTNNCRCYLLWREQSLSRGDSINWSPSILAPVGKDSNLAMLHQRPWHSPKPLLHVRLIKMVQLLGHSIIIVGHPLSEWHRVRCLHGTVAILSREFVAWRTAHVLFLCIGDQSESIEHELGGAAAKHRGDNHNGECGRDDEILRQNISWIQIQCKTPHHRVTESKWYRMFGVDVERQCKGDGAS